jgi:Type VI secretion system (T6SS), amidase immunity protein
MRGIGTIGATLLTLACACVPLAAQPLPTGTSPQAQKNQMKKWALSICFARITSDEQTKKDAGATARAYLENSSQDVEDFAQIGKLIDQFLARPYAGSDKGSYQTMKCIDLFHSKELAQLTAKLVRHRAGTHGRQ